MLTDYMKRIIKEQKIGYVATVCADGTPNLSPKGTFVILDDQTILFSEIRSPITLENVLERPAMEINFLDLFSRKGVRLKGKALFIARDSDEFGKLIPLFVEWLNLQDRMNGIFKLQIEQARHLTSPSYDIGLKEEDLRHHWKQYFTAL